MYAPYSDIESIPHSYDALDSKNGGTPFASRTPTPFGDPTASSE